MFVLVNKTSLGSLLSTAADWRGAACVHCDSVQRLLQVSWGWPGVVLTPELRVELPGTLPVGFSETDAKDYVNSY